MEKYNRSDRLIFYVPKFSLNFKSPSGDGTEFYMFFKKAERRKLPICTALLVGGLAAVGFCSIKRRSKEMCATLSSKMKRMFSQKENDNKMMPLD